jgi:hypothetical protein
LYFERGMECQINNIFDEIAVRYLRKTAPRIDCGSCGTMWGRPYGVYAPYLNFSVARQVQALPNVEFNHQ